MQRGWAGNAGAPGARPCAGPGGGIYTSPQDAGGRQVVDQEASLIYRRSQVDELTAGAAQGSSRGFVGLRTRALGSGISFVFNYYTSQVSDH